MVFSNYFNEYAAAFSATLITAAAGTTVAWPSPTIPFLLSDASPIPTTPDQSSWIASLMMLSSAVSPIPAAYMADRIGRKRTLMLSAIPYILGWILIMVATNVETIYTSRIISGLGYGIAYTTAPMYLGEIASDDVRGSMATLITVMSKAGMLAQYCIGPYVSMFSLASFNMVIPILFALVFSIMPESPYFYLKMGQREIAEESLRKLRGRRYLNDELVEMEQLVNNNMKEVGKWSDLIKYAGNRKALIILLGIYFVQQFCGSTAVITYAQQIFGAAGGGFGASESCIVFGIVQVVTSTLSSQLVDRLGRKPLLLFSTGGISLANTIIATYFLLKYYKYEIVEEMSLVPIIVIPIFILSYTIGLATVPFAITAEVFPTNVKSKATCIIQIFVALATSAVTKIFQVIADNLGTHVAFFGFAVISLAGVLFVMALLPETKGLSLATIQHKLNSRKSDIKVSYDEKDQEIRIVNGAK